MNLLTARSCLLSSMLILLISAGAIYGIDRFGRNSRVFGTIGSLQAPTVVKKQVAAPQDAYRLWKEAGYQGRTIVFVADRWESFDPGELIPSQMFRAYPLQLYNTARLLESDYLNGVTLLYVASMNKICRRIVAILPEGEVDRLKKMARTSKDYQVSEKGIFVSRQGYPRWFTARVTDVNAGEPVLLYIGASYFKHAEPDELYRQLASSGLQTDCVILSTESGKDSVTPAEVSRLNRFARLIGINV